MTRETLIRAAARVAVVVLCLLLAFAAILVFTWWLWITQYQEFPAETLFWFALRDIVRSVRNIGEWLLNLAVALLGLYAVGRVIWAVFAWLLRAADWLPEEEKAKNEELELKEFRVGDDGEIEELEASS